MKDNTRCHVNDAWKICTFYHRGFRVSNASATIFCCIRSKTDVYQNGAVIGIYDMHMAPNRLFDSVSYPVQSYQDTCPVVEQS